MVHNCKDNNAKREQAGKIPQDEKCFAYFGFDEGEIGHKRCSKAYEYIEIVSLKRGRPRKDTFHIQAPYQQLHHYPEALKIYRPGRWYESYEIPETWCGKEIDKE